MLMDGTLYCIVYTICYNPCMQSICTTFENGYGMYMIFIVNIVTQLVCSINQNFLSLEYGLTS